jgi:hypothetical protein
MARRRFRKFPLHLVPRFLVVCLVSLGGRCAAQEIEVPPGPHGPGYVVAPTGYLELIVPLQDRFGLRLYGFYAGELEAPGAQLDVPIRTTKFLTITPSYLYIVVPASGLNTVVSRSRRDLLAVTRRTNFELTQQSSSPSTSSRSSSATCMSEGFVRQMKSTAIAIESD